MAGFPPSRDIANPISPADATRWAGRPFPASQAAWTCLFRHASIGPVRLFRFVRGNVTSIT
jgi:hypothetical protein